MSDTAGAAERGVVILRAVRDNADGRGESAGGRCLESLAIGVGGAVGAFDLGSGGEDYSPSFNNC